MRLSNEELLEKLEKISYWTEIDKLIKSLDITDEQFELLAEHNSSKFRIAMHPNTPENLIYKLASGDKNVRRGLAQNPNLPKDLMYKLSEDKYSIIRYFIPELPKLTEDLIIRLSCDGDYLTQKKAFKKLRNLNSLKSEDLESAYDLINNSKYIGRKHFEETFDFIIDKFPELSKLAEMFKTIILKGKKDLK